MSTVQLQAVSYIVKTADWTSGMGVTVTVSHPAGYDETYELPDVSSHTELGPALAESTQSARVAVVGRDDPTASNDLDSHLVLIYLYDDTTTVATISVMNNGVEIIGTSSSLPISGDPIPELNALELQLSDLQDERQDLLVQIDDINDKIADASAVESTLSNNLASTNESIASIRSAGEAAVSEIDDVKQRLASSSARVTELKEEIETRKYLAVGGAALSGVNILRRIL